jgi:hypothetical protein
MEKKVASKSKPKKVRVQGGSFGGGGGVGGHGKKAPAKKKAGK